MMAPQIATMTPWVLTRPSQFRLPPPLALDSPENTAYLNEVREMGSLASTSRFSEQTEVALFWALNTPLAWNRIAAQLSLAHDLSLTENTHLFAVLNVALADAIIACWDSKYRCISWRPRHGDPNRCRAGRPRRQLEAVAGLTDRHSRASRVSVGAFHLQWCRRVHPCRCVWREHCLRRHLRDTPRDSYLHEFLRRDRD